jgi:hypothetical protein
VAHKAGTQAADIQALEDMGFDSARVRAALRRSHNDVLAATNLLLDGTV